jgi:hypothetical protein
MMRSLYKNVRQPALGRRCQPTKSEAKQAVPEMWGTLENDESRYREVQREPNTDDF